IHLRPGPDRERRRQACVGDRLSRRQLPVLEMGLHHLEARSGPLHPGRDRVGVSLSRKVRSNPEDDLGFDPRLHEPGRCNSADAERFAINTRAEGTGQAKTAAKGLIGKTKLPSRVATPQPRACVPDRGPARRRRRGSEALRQSAGLESSLRRGARRPGRPRGAPRYPSVAHDRGNISATDLAAYLTDRACRKTQIATAAATPNMTPSTQWPPIRNSKATSARI